MTSQFDDLGFIWQQLQKFPKLSPIVSFVALQAIKEADTKEPETLTFEKWLAERKEHKSFETAFTYLGVCHQKLDHGNWHLKVFTYPTEQLIYALARSLRTNMSGERMDFSLGRDEKKVLAAFPELYDILQKSGYTVDQRMKTSWKFTP